MSDRFTTMLLKRIDNLKARLEAAQREKGRKRARAEMWKRRALAKGKR